MPYRKGGRRRSSKGLSGLALTDFLDSEKAGRDLEDEKFGSGEVGGDRHWEAPVHGATTDGTEVTVSFGREDSGREGETLLADGHAQSLGEFYGPGGNKQHDHYYGDGGGSERGKYTGEGS